MLTQSFLLALYDYNPETGLLVYRVRFGSRGKVGTTVGSLNNLGYMQTSIYGKSYLLHRLIWMYMYGNIPKYLDHINGVKSDNRLSNLRAATCSENSCNKSVQSNNKFGIKGLSYVKPHGRKKAGYKATVSCLGTVYKKIIYLTEGRYDEEIIQELSNWLKETREGLHKEFTNNT